MKQVCKVSLQTQIDFCHVGQAVHEWILNSTASNHDNAARLVYSHAKTTYNLTWLTSRLTCGGVLGVKKNELMAMSGMAKKTRHVMKNVNMVPIRCQGLYMLFKATVHHILSLYRGCRTLLKINLVNNYGHKALMHKCITSIYSHTLAMNKF